MHSRRMVGPGILAVIAVLATAVALAFTQQEPADAATFTVNSTADAPDANPGDGVCLTGAAVCTLRAAVMEANALAGADTITLPAGTYQFTLPGWENAGLSGDLDILDDVTINGGGQASTIIDAADLDRIISVFSGTANVSGLTMRNGTGDYGGGVYTAAFANATLNLTNVTVTENVATGFAGGINNGGNLTLTNSLVISNSTANQTGGVLNNFGTMTITNSTISSNSSGTGPGGFYNFNGATATITNSTIYNNSGGRGGIENGSGTVTVTNSTISGNRGKGNGGGVYSEASTSLLNVTITDNTADSDGNGSGDGGGVYIPSWASLSLKNTIISGNSDLSGTTVEADCHAPPDNGGLVSGGNNLIQDITGCTITGDTANNVTGQSAMLAPIAGNGGATLTHALQAGSPAIDYASEDCPPPATDQRGIARPQGNRCDIGAFESSLSGPTPAPTPSPTPSPSPSETPTPTGTEGPSGSPTGSPTPTATPTPIPTGTGTPISSPTATPTATPTPTGTPEGPLQGDVDCDRDADSVDSLKVLRYVASLSVSQNEPCTDIGEEIASLMGDVDCDGDVDSVDALKVLRFVAGLSVSQNEPCTDIGTRA